MKLRGKAIEILIEFLLMCGIMLVINLVWVGLEHLFYGQAQPSYADTVIGYFFCVSLYCNLRNRIVFRLEG